METIRKIRLAIHRDGKTIRQTVRDLGVSRNTIRKVIRSQQAAFKADDLINCVGALKQ